MKFKVTFIRDVREYHEGSVEAENQAAVERMYDDGEIETTVLDSRLLNETGPSIETDTD